ncbi:C4-dicarboxylate-binding periplasmic protein precursor [Pseudovibrio sp. Ad13]|uniref:TRAP transporter substrate-binding protein DctP n=1 Tax=unclassified Pseudovibrio TaxID=2627060 RepID=UPI0007AEDDF1|nr:MULTISPECIES: TRAP transporter substrate-binding protein DctP [unclassified Pseudovibrio]KZK75979.1 C4-dicarboxylate-binding periplasmic protein precursor [Pseudovibrio sp. Ad13]KZL03597.1 C4-dicarboxylate-binding periplasmic protein precursor [Pseudovibrio sp. W74]KZL09689.1 C4-dicarboxylate-binding periplasmic protein precursor [Pseudovibrio sp. Ad14]
MILKALKTTLALATIIGGVSAASVAHAKTLKISHIRPQGATVDLEVKDLAEELKKATNGDLKMKIFAASALGDYTTVQERISVGAIDMAVQPAATAVERKMQISAFPYVAENWEQAQKIYGPGGAIHDAMKELYAKQDITMLAAYPVYFGGIALNRDAVAPGDPNADKGIKVRVPGIKSFQLTADALGYISSPIPFSEAFTAVQTGVVDGVVGSGAEGYYASFRDVAKTYIPVNTHFEVWYLIINSERFEGLDESSRKALVEAAKEFEAKRWAKAESDQGAFEQKLADYGATIVNLSDDELAAAAKKVRADVWPQILNDVGADWGQSILEKIKN